MAVDAERRIIVLSGAGKNVNIFEKKKQQILPAVRFVAFFSNMFLDSSSVSFMSQIDLGN